jgi:dihydropteroate synthase
VSATRPLLPEGGAPAVMAIVNRTPDSFYDRGAAWDPGAAADAVDRAVAEGADIVDVGGESTRPGSDPVPADEECRRVLSVI